MFAFNNKKVLCCVKSYLFILQAPINFLIIQWVTKQIDPLTL